MIMYKFNYNKLGIKRNVNINVTGKYYLNLYVFVLTFSAADSTSREGGDSISMRTVTPVHQSGPKPRGKFQACIMLSIPPPPVGGGIKSNGLEMGKKIKSLKKRKKKIFEDLTLLAVPKGKM